MVTEPLDPVTEEPPEIDTDPPVPRSAEPPSIDTSPPLEVPDTP